MSKEATLLQLDKNYDNPAFLKYCNCLKMVSETFFYPHTSLGWNVVLNLLEMCNVEQFQWTF